MARPKTFIIGVEQIAEKRIEFAVPNRMLGKNQSFEKPGGVREMPFRRTRIRHGLDGLVFTAQTRCQRFRLLTDSQEFRSGTPIRSCRFAHAASCALIPAEYRPRTANTIATP